jgi:hypothetical protein
VPSTDLTDVPIPGDWDDVRVAAGVGVGAIEASILDTTASDEEIRFDLVTIRSEPGLLTVRRAGPDSVRATASVGRFGDPAREQRLLHAFARRLEQLHGVDYAPR